MKNELTAKRIQTALSNSNMKPQELADRAGIGKASISQYVNGSHAPGNVSAEKIGTILNVNPLWLMGFDVPKERTPVASKASPKILQYYEQLNDIGKREATKRVAELTEVPRYVKEDTNYVNAAHALADATEEEIRHDEDIMDAEDF